MSKISAKTFARDLSATILSKAGVLFNRIDDTAAGFAKQLGEIGLGDRAAAKPYAMAWAAEKYGEMLEEGQRGYKLVRGGAAERAYYRVLNAVFPGEESVFAKGGKSNNADPVARLVKAYEKLTPAQKRSFKAMLAKA